MRKITFKQATFIFISSILITFLFALKAYSEAKIDINRDYEYENYCDSIWENNPEYYLDVLVESDEYQDYIDEHGQWWKNNQ